MALSCTVFWHSDFEKFCDLEIRDTGHSRSSELLRPFDSLHVVSY